MTNVASLAALIGRVLIAYVFVSAGLAKLGDIPGSMAYTASGGLPGFFAIPALALEILGGLAILVGWQTRAAAWALAAFAVVAGLLFHYLPAQSLDGMNAYVQILMFQKNLVIAGGLLVLGAFGPGALSIEARQGRAALA
jgi:putative oxidoreductase